MFPCSQAAALLIVKRPCGSGATPTASSEPASSAIARIASVMKKELPSL